MTENAAAPAAPPPPSLFRDRAVSAGRSLWRPALIVAAHFLVFTFARIALVLRYPGDFGSLSTGEVAWAFVRGLRFDGAIIFLVIGIPVFLLMLPLRWAQGRRCQGLLGWFCFGTLLLFSFLLACDVLYFGYVHQHVGSELMAPGEAAEAVALTGAVQYVLPFLAFVAASVGAFFGWRWMMRKDPPPASDVPARTVITLVCLAFMVAGWRGAFHGRKTKLIDAFDGVPQAAGYIALNGPFSILESRDSRAIKTDFYPWPEALRTTQEALLSGAEVAGEPDFPMVRSRSDHASSPTSRTRSNVVLIMLESWDAIYTDALRREMGLPPIGLTPNFDAISKEGVLFSRFYAAGQKSMHGMAALLAGVPTLPRAPYLGHGMERCALPFLGHLAKQEGYDTIFIQSSHRTAFRNDSVSAMAGFTTYLGAEDVPPVEPAAGRGILAGAAWDHEMFTEANRRLAAAKRPFLAFLYTATTHSPFAWPTKEWEKYPGGDAASRYKNSLAYADWALGKFFEGAKAAGYFDKTIFILTADHVGGPYPGTLGDRAEIFHIPGLVIGPGLAPGIDRRVGGQLDVIPTIAELNGWSSPYAAFGRSLFQDGPGRGAFSVHGDHLLRIEDGGSMLHSLSRRGETRAYAESPDFDGMERRLLSICQVAATLMRKNRLFPAATGARKE